MLHLSSSFISSLLLFPSFTTLSNSLISLFSSPFISLFSSPLSHTSVAPLNLLVFVSLSFIITSSSQLWPTFCLSLPFISFSFPTFLPFHLFLYNCNISLSLSNLFLLCLHLSFYTYLPPNHLTYSLTCFTFFQPLLLCPALFSFIHHPLYSTFQSNVLFPPLLFPPLLGIVSYPFLFLYLTRLYLYLTFSFTLPPGVFLSWDDTNVSY